MSDGLKSVSGGFASLGKALLTNPIFLLATAVTLIITNFEKLTPGGRSRGFRASYRDISRRYQFPSGLRILGDVVFALEVVHPDIDIERVELSLEADIFGVNCSGLKPRSVPLH